MATGEGAERLGSDDRAHESGRPGDLPGWMESADSGSAGTARVYRHSTAPTCPPAEEDPSLRLALELATRRFRLQLCLAFVCLRFLHFEARRTRRSLCPRHFLVRFRDLCGERLIAESVGRRGVEGHDTEPVAVAARVGKSDGSETGELVLRARAPAHLRQDEGVRR